MILYHFSTSPYARRVRLALALKGMTAELRDSRAQPEYMAELKRLNPLQTVPVLVDGTRTVIDSLAICRYLEHVKPEPALWPQDPEAFEITALADSATNILIDTGMRYYALSSHESFPGVRDFIVGRAQGALQLLADRVAGRKGPLCDGRWSYADIALFTSVTWLEGLPLRAQTQQNPKQIMSLGWSLPATLSKWADQHRTRPDVIALA
jgi:glutathione S-transferase